jgi:MoaA/NifB/PqqE/SkfB family radical SAM enzyme
MFNFSELHSVHLEITNNCQASCPMCSRNNRGGLENPNIKINEWTLNDFCTIFDKEVLKQVKNIFFCGNFGDPIINNNLAEMCEYASNENPNLQIRIHTNGGARSKDWWKSLPSKLPRDHFVIFGIDGLEDTHSLYRVGTKYEQVIENAKAFIEAGGTAEWVFIKFKHNEHQVDEARNRAKELGFKLFTVKNSTRFLEEKFKVLDKKGNTLYYLEPPTTNQVSLITPDMIKNYKSWVDDSKIECYVQQNREIYIDAYKNVFPCCFLASTPYNYTEDTDFTFPVRQEIRKQYATLVESLGGIEHLSATAVGIKNILESNSWQTVWDYFWNDYKLITCARTCGVSTSKSISKPKDQFVERSNLKEE